MGVDKARLPFGSETVLERVISSVTPLELPIYLVCAAYEEAEDERTTWLRSFELPIVADLHPDLGPLGGLHTALSKTGAERLLLLRWRGVCAPSPCCLLSCRWWRARLLLRLLLG